MFIQVLGSYVCYHILVIMTLGLREQYSSRNKFKFQFMVRVIITVVPNAGK